MNLCIDSDSAGCGDHCERGAILSPLSVHSTNAPPHRQKSWNSIDQGDTQELNTGQEFNTGILTYGQTDTTEHAGAQHGLNQPPEDGWVIHSDAIVSNKARAIAFQVNLYIFFPFTACFFFTAQAFLADQ